MKKTAFILFVAMLLASCDSNISPEIANAFKGEYWMKTITTVNYSNNGSLESVQLEGWSPVSIYEENGNDINSMINVLKSRTRILHLGIRMVIFLIIQTILTI